jgi:tRNA (guanine-N7-)-methyltransferase
MSRKSKLQKFADNLSFPNVFENFDIKNPSLVGQNGEIVTPVLHWASTHFGNQHAIILELACGKGEYTLALARKNPHQNYIGVDIKGARIWKGAKRGLEAGIQNAAFLRTRIECLDAFFSNDDIDEIWITFPDPFPRKSKVNRRLTSPHFLLMYRKFLKKKGIVHLKTDDPGLYAFTLETIKDDPLCELIYTNNNIYAGPLQYDDLEIKTYYENMHLEAKKQITYVRFTIH